MLWKPLPRTLKEQSANGFFFVAVKLPLAEPDYVSVIDEIKVLRNFRGAAHIVQLLAPTTDGPPPDEASTPMAWFKTFTVEAGPTGTLRKIVKNILRPPPAWYTIGPGLSAPALVLEYVENGSLFDLLTRISKLGIAVPNRMLWAFFLCCR